MRRRGVCAALLLALGLTMLSGCDLRNRQSSEDFVPAGTAAPIQIPTRQEQTGPELVPGQSGGYHVKTVLSRDGEYIYTNPAIAYNYDLPFIDLGGSQAVGCNQEIETRFGQPIRSSLEAMERRETPVVRTVSFYSYVYGSVLTVRVDRVDVDGSRINGVYTVNAETGERVTVEEFCSAVGMTEETMHERLDEAAEERLRVITEGSYSAEDPAYVAALTQTRAALAEDDLNLYLEADGTLICIAEICTPSGSVSREELRLG